MRNHRYCNYVWILFIFLILLGFTLAAYGADEKKTWSIRVGKHDQYTRVVFDMKQSVAYEIAPQSGDGKNVRVIFKQGALAAEEYILLFDTGLVSRIHVKPQAQQTFAEILMIKSAKVKEHFRLDAPYRVIVDVAQDRALPD